MEDIANGINEAFIPEYSVVIQVEFMETKYVPKTRYRHSPTRILFMSLISSSRHTLMSTLDTFIGCTFSGL